MKKHVLVLGALATLVVAGVAAAGGGFNSAKPATFDPARTYLVGTAWVAGIGCPSNSKIYNGTNVGLYTDPACTTGAPGDKKNAGLLLAKSGPTLGNYAAAQVNLSKVPATITELGYDIRKAGGDVSDPRGSHCGGGAPRFNVYDDTGALHFLGCNSVPAPTVAASSDGWLRLRWDVSALYSGLTITQVQIVFDEGQDTGGGPDNFGLAVLDNIDVNGTLVGK